MINEITITSMTGRGSVVMTRGDRYGYWLEDVDWGQVQGQHNTYSYYNQVGSDIVSTSVNTRGITITGLVFEKNGTMRDRLNALNMFISPVEDYELEYQGKKIRFRPDSSVIYSREFISNNRKMRKFLIQATAAYPLFMGVENTVVDFSSDTGMFLFPNAFGTDGSDVVFGTTQRAHSATAFNDGGFETGIVAGIHFTNTVENPAVYNSTTGKFVKVNRTFSAGEILSFCTVQGKKYMTMTDVNGAVSNIIQYRDYEMSWIQLEPGENIIVLSCDDESQIAYMTATVYFTPLYMEVE